MTIPKVLVHGVPESSAIWEPMLERLADLGHDQVTLLSPPGFGAPLPSNFAARLYDYRDWLIDELSRFNGPVDLVGHDFGGGHVINVAMTRPDLLHSWATDVIGVMEPDYVWHPLAQIWQTPGEGERNVAEFFEAPASVRAATMVEWGFPEPVASKVATSQDVSMGRAILTLYRSAIQPVTAQMGEGLASAAVRPGLAVIASKDVAVGSVEQHRRAAARARARTETLEGLGHWWMLEDPDRGARMLADFWGR